MPVLSLACHLPHNTPHIPSRYNNEQTTKQTKAINNAYIYIYISQVNVTQTVPDISPLMPMHQDPLLGTSIVYRLESPVHRTPRGRTIRELLCGLVCYLYIEPCVSCVTIRRIHTAGINIYYICTRYLHPGLIRTSTLYHHQFIPHGLLYS